MDQAQSEGSDLTDLVNGTGRRMFIGPGDRDELVAMATASFPGGVFRKTARIVAVMARGPFTVMTDRGPMAGEAGDWIATNHPDDDPGSDVWTISADRMDATYVGASGGQQSPGLDRTEGQTPSPAALIQIAIDKLGEPVPANSRRDSRHAAMAIGKLEEALLWLGADVL